MPTNTNFLEAWQNANDALILSLAAATEIMNGQPFSEEASSLYQRARAEIRVIQGELNRLALAGLVQIDEAIANGDVVQGLTQLAREAKEEAQALDNAAKTLETVAKAVDMVAGVVTKIAGLPFL